MTPHTRTHTHWLCILRSSLYAESLGRRFSEISICDRELSLCICNAPRTNLCTECKNGNKESTEKKFHTLRAPYESSFKEIVAFFLQHK